MALASSCCYPNPIMNAKIVTTWPVRRAAFAAALILSAPLAGIAGDTPAAAAKPADAKYQKAGFDVLASYTFVAAELDPSAPAGTPPPSGAKQIPAPAKA